MMNAATRKAPHCFNFLRQVRILRKCGGGSVDQQIQDSDFFQILLREPGRSSK